MMQNMHLMEVSHSTAHGRQMLACSLQSSSVFKSFGREVYVNI